MNKLNILIEKLDKPIECEIEVYDSTNRIPLSVCLGKDNSFSESIYARNLHGGDFVEFNFDRYSRSLFEFSLISFQKSSINRVGAIKVKNIKEGFYSCKVLEGSQMEVSEQMKILYNDKSISIDWSRGNRELQYYSLAEKLTFGLNGCGELKALVMSGLTECQVISVFGLT